MRRNAGELLKLLVVGAVAGAMSLGFSLAARTARKAYTYQEGRAVGRTSRPPARPRSRDAVPPRPPSGSAGSARAPYHRHLTANPHT